MHMCGLCEINKRNPFTKFRTLEYWKFREKSIPLDSPINLDVAERKLNIIATRRFLQSFLSFSIQRRVLSHGGKSARISLFMFQRERITLSILAGPNYGAPCPFLRSSLWDHYRLPKPQSEKTTARKSTNIPKACEKIMEECTGDRVRLLQSL